MPNTDYSGAGSYATSPTQMPWTGWRAVLKRCFNKIGSMEMSLRCAGAAFFSFLAIFPILACLALLYGIFTSRAVLLEHMQRIRQFVPQTVYDVIAERLQSLIDQPDTGLGIGFAIAFSLALWSGSRGTNALIAAINAAYREEDDRSFLKGIGLSVGMTLGALLFLITSLFAIAAIPVLTQTMPFPSLFETLALWLRWPILALLVAVCLGALYRMAPHREPAKIAWLTPGAVLATLLWLALSGLFSIYVQSFANFDATFGSLSIAVVMMMWLYYSTLIVSLGATLNAELEFQTRRDTTTGPNQPMGDRGAVVADNHISQPSKGEQNA